MMSCHTLPEAVDPGEAADDPEEDGDDHRHREVADEDLHPHRLELLAREKEEPEPREEEGDERAGDPRVGDRARAQAREGILKAPGGRLPGIPLLRRPVPRRRALRSVPGIPLLRSLRRPISRRRTLRRPVPGWLRARRESGLPALSESTRRVALRRLSVGRPALGRLSVGLP